MISKLLSDANLFYLLYQIDLDLALQCRDCRCPYCGSVLHFARYARKPRGGPRKIPDEYRVRQSLCCCAPDCRGRVLPASCLFMGRRVYWRCVILVVVALSQQRPRGVSIYKLRQMFGIDKKTINRWIGYFRQIFVRGKQWRALRGRISPLVDDSRLPASLLEHFFTQIADYKQAIIACSKFLSASDLHAI